MGFFDKLGKKLNKDITNLYNNKFAQQDLNIASEIREFYPIKKTPNDNNYKFYLEGIFLGQGDRTAAHPYYVKPIPGGKSNFIDSQLGFGDKKIDYREDPSFDTDDYFNSNWFHPILDIYPEKKNELDSAKKLYRSRKINFFDYFIKRLEVYDFAQEKDHIKYFEGVDRSKYIALLRDEFRTILN